MIQNEPRLSVQARGVRIIASDLARERRAMLGRIIARLEAFGASEIVLPSIEPAELYTDNAGPEVLGQMYAFEDRQGRKLCLRPEGTATCQALARDDRRLANDTKLWYEARCWRYEKPQAGRYREFTQVGLEVFNAAQTTEADLAELVMQIVASEVDGALLDQGANRGLVLYAGGRGFEVRVPSLGAQQQVAGGGAYAEGIGFAIGLDRLLLARMNQQA
jgi:histidyl-tRNA synthetase